MKIKDVLKVKGSQVWTAKANQPVSEALRSLVTHRIGALLVAADDKGREIIGILSERDIVRGAYLNIKTLDRLSVQDLMTRKVFTCSPEDEIDIVMALMTEKRVRHVPVLSEGELQGIVSIGDVVKALLEDSEHQIRHLREYMFGPSTWEAE